MGRFLIRRGVAVISVMFIVSVLTFAVLQWLPGDPAEIILGVNASPAALANLRATLGLDHPWYVQYLHWLLAAIHGNFGTSLVFGQPVGELIVQRLPVTLSLTAMSLVITVLVAVPLGVIAAAMRGGWPDRVIRLTLQIALGVPSFWIGLLFILWFAISLHWLPVGGFPGFRVALWPSVQSLIMPAISLSIGEIAVLGRVVRRSMVDTLDAPYMVTTMSKGLQVYRRYIRHALRTAMIVPVTMIGLQVASLLGGAVIIENVFALPGIGRLLLVAVQQKDYPLLEGLTVFIALVVLSSSLIVDMLYAVLDPRIRLQ